MAESSKRLELSVYLPTWRDQPGQLPSWCAMRDLAQQAEAMGLDAVFVGDHSGFERPDGPSTEFWDGWTLLPALAEATTRIAIGPVVTVPHLRHPVALARMATALDEVSGGRLILGVGSAGPIERALRVLGISTERLYSRFEEAVEIIVPLLHNGVVDFQGRYFRAHNAVLGPTGPQGHTIPIWIGVKGPRMTMLAARWADAVNFGLPVSSPDTAQTLIGPFDSVCRAVGRDPSTVKKTGWAMLSPRGVDTGATAPWEFAIAGEAAEIAAQLHAVHAIGIDHITCYIDLGDEPGPKRTYPVITADALGHLAQVLDALRMLENGR